MSFRVRRFVSSAEQVARRLLFVFAACSVTAALSACAPRATLTPGSGPPTVTVAVSPATTSVAAGGASVTFGATISNATNSGVTWAVNGVGGGNSTIGTISSSGQYLSPARVPSPATVTVTATSVADPADSGSATMTVMSTSSLSVAVSPVTAEVVVAVGTQAFVATVTNGATSSVTWQVNGVTGGNSTVGTISAGGVYSAPATIPAQSTVTITAVSVADTGKSSSASVTIVSISAAPPTIAGNPALSIGSGQPYSFTPVASSPRGAALTFSIVGLPSWASFNPGTGQLSGTPATSDIGTYANVSISVSDGTAVASLPPFTITVTASSLGSATLSWSPPTTRTDETPLTDLAGFHIYYGTSQGSYPNSITVANPSLTTYVVDGLPGGTTYYFVATAYDTSGIDSDFSVAASKAIP